MAESERDRIAEAVAALCRGGIIAFPTETVYGLGADARSSEAIGKIYAAKGRPATNPSIVHVPDAGTARRYAAKWPEAAEKLAAKFWPGPLTLVVEKTDQIVPEATAGRKTVGLRVPNHPVALKLLKAFGGPVAAPSANRSGRVSPTTAEHVWKELGKWVDVILDGGACSVGIESTVLDLTQAIPIILRLGGVSRKEIESLIGQVDVFDSSVAAGVAAASPGMSASHYSPTTPAYRFAAGDGKRIVEWLSNHPGQGVTILALNRTRLPQEMVATQSIVIMPMDAGEYAKRLYSALHKADGTSGSIWIEMPPDHAEWAAVRDRLQRATKSS
jgi:L-threonylcarbamoyladenylate synthase